MAPRRSHKKSKNGCSTCKRRRVKASDSRYLARVQFADRLLQCDEEGPPCGKCVSHRTECTYESSLSVQGSSNSQSASPDSSGPDAVTTCSRQNVAHGYRANCRLLELELMHHWCTNTHTSFYHNDEPRYVQNIEIWRTEVVKEAFKHDFLLSGILAVTALHISVTETATRSAQEISQYNMLAFEYHDDASRKFRSSLATLTPGNNTAAYAFSIINMGWTLALARRAGSSAINVTVSHGESFVSHIKTFFHMMQGVRSIFEHSARWLEVGPFHVKVAPNVASEFELEHLESGTKAVFQSLDEENQRCYQNASPKLYETNRAGIDLLRRCFAAQPDKPGHTGFMWPPLLDRDFLQVLDANDPVALLAVMHWGVLVHHIRNERWWVGPAGKSLVSEISYLLFARKLKSKVDEERRARLLAWPRRQVGLAPMVPCS